MSTRSCIKAILAFVCGVILIMPAKIASAVTKDEFEKYKRACESILQETFFELPAGSTKNRLLTDSELEEKRGKMGQMMGSSEYAMKLYERVFNELAQRLKSEATTSDSDLALWNDRLIRGLQDSYEITRDTIELMKSAGGFEIQQFNLVEKQVAKRISDNAQYHHELKNEIETMISPWAVDATAIRKMSEGLPVQLYVETTWK